MRVFLIIFWVIISVLMFENVLPHVRDLRLPQKLAVFATILAFGIFMAIADFGNLLLDALLPDGWDGEN